MYEQGNRIFLLYITAILDSPPQIDPETFTWIMPIAWIVVIGAKCLSHDICVKIFLVGLHSYMYLQKESNTCTQSDLENKTQVNYRRKNIQNDGKETIMNYEHRLSLFLPTIKQLSRFICLSTNTP